MVLPRQHRLKGQRVFNRLYRQGRRFQGESLVLRVMAAESQLLPPEQRGRPASPWRCGVVVSAKVSKRAVQRNRLRRLLHDHLLRNLGATPPCPNSAPPPTPSPSPPPQWLLISLKPGCNERDPEQLLGECSDLLRKAGLSHD